jgi:hypothetical protein
MEKVVGSKSMEFLRRTAPIKVSIGLLYRELDAAKNEHAVTIDRALFESVITTLELVVEEIEARMKVEERKVVGVEASPGAPRMGAINRS